MLKLTQGQTTKKLYEKYQIIQDMLVPFDAMKDALLCFHKEVKASITLYDKVNMCICENKEKL